MSTAIGYLRVSGQQQVDEGNGLEAQERAIVEWAQRGGHQVIAWYRDEGISGAKEQADRPGLGAAIAAVEDSAEGLVVAALDRLARDLVIQETIFAQLERKGRAVWSVREPDLDGNSPTRILIRQVLGAISQYERAVIAARMQGGRRIKHEKGGYAYGRPRFGARAEGRELAPDVAELETVARIVQLHTAGGSLRSIASALNGEGRLPKEGGRWWPETVRRVLSRIPDQPVENMAEAA